jgi:hypothetical protein
MSTGIEFPRFRRRRDTCIDQALLQLEHAIAGASTPNLLDAIAFLQKHGYAARLFGSPEADRSAACCFVKADIDGDVDLPDCGGPSDDDCWPDAGPAR